MPSRLNLNKLQDALHTRVLGRTILFSREIGSTNEWAKELARLGASEGTVVVSETQAHGYGRNMRTWFSPEGGLWFSMILRPKLKPREAPKLAFIAGLAVAEILRELYVLHAETRWPNDVMVNGRKICGILSEMTTSGDSVEFVIVGIGVNANFDPEALPKSIRLVATTLENELGRSVQLEQLFQALLEKLETLYDLFMREGFHSILKKWKEYASFLGKKVEVSAGSEIMKGLGCDVDEEGALILRLEEGISKRFLAGDVSLSKTEK